MDHIQLGPYDDLRFARGPIPLMTFSGHINSYSNKLVRLFKRNGTSQSKSDRIQALTVDPSEAFFFAAGQDMRIIIRAWSLHTGNALHPRYIRQNSDTILRAILSTRYSASRSWQCRLRRRVMRCCCELRRTRIYSGII